MNDSYMSARWIAFSKLQRLQGQLYGTRYADDAEHATTLALSEARPTTNPKYLAYDAMRDARRIRIRRRLGSAAFPKDAGDDAFNFQIDCFGYYSNQPDQIATANEIEFALRQRLATITNATECLEGLLSGEREEITARRLGLKRYRISELRAIVRQATKEIVGVEVAA